MTALAADSGGDEGLPDESWLNRDIENWASAHGIDLGGVTRKADMLAVIREAQE